MIVDKLENASMYAGCCEKLAGAFRWLCETDLTAIDTGRHDIDGDNVFALVQDYETKPLSQGFLEAHRKYTDIQYIVSGVERIGYANIDDVTSEPYDQEKDFLKLTGPADMITMNAGMFAVFCPQDAHMPGIAVEESSAVRKVVVKVIV